MVIIKQENEKSSSRLQDGRYFRIYAVMAVFILSVFMIFPECLHAGEADEKGGASSGEKEKISKSAVFQKIIGQWVRPDGGYILKIKSVDEKGTLEAAYYNPKPINVSKAQVSQKGNELRVFIELTDTGYPGATYALSFNEKEGTLSGVYFQPSVQQTFDVFFLRMKTGE